MNTINIKISDNVRKILGVSTVTIHPKGYALRLPAGQLERSLYTEVDKTLKALGGKWNRGAAAHLFVTDPRVALEDVAEGGSIVDKKKTFQAFYTPAAVADRLVILAAENGAFDTDASETKAIRILEPSAGEGAIIKALRRKGDFWITAVEIDATNGAKLQDSWADTIYTEDFLKLNGALWFRRFDAVLMNPPFSNGQDIAHVTHAWQFVRPGGLLAAIISPAFQTRQDKAHEAFRELHRKYVVDGEEVPAGAFKESGTNVRTVMIVWKKPAEETTLAAA